MNKIENSKSTIKKMIEIIIYICLAGIVMLSIWLHIKATNFKSEENNFIRDISFDGEFVPVEVWADESGAKHYGYIYKRDT